MFEENVRNSGRKHLVFYKHRKIKETVKSCLILALLQPKMHKIGILY